jgi:FixJ family two-component response regulator
MSGSPLRRNELAGLSAAYFLEKPFTNETLAEAVARATGREPAMRPGECT